MTESPTSKSPMARDRHSPPGQMRSGPTPLSTLLAGPVAAGGRGRGRGQGGGGDDRRVESEAAGRAGHAAGHASGWGGCCPELRAAKPQCIHCGKVWLASEKKQALLTLALALAHSPEPEKSMGAMVAPMASTRRRSPLCDATRWSTAAAAAAAAR